MGLISLNPRRPQNACLDPEVQQEEEFCFAMKRYFEALRYYAVIVTELR